MRISEGMKFGLMFDKLSRIQSEINSLTEQQAYEKKINRPSDDPAGMTKILGFRSARASIEQYQRNMDNARAGLEVTESVLSGISDLLSQVQGIGGEGMSPETMAANLQHVRSLTNEIRSLANSTYGGRYLFAGSVTDCEPFAEEAFGATVGVAGAAGNVGDASATPGGTYTGAVNKTFVVKFEAGDVGTASYRISSDGGLTFGDLSSVWAGSTIDIGDGAAVTFDPEGAGADFSTDDIFTVDAYAPGYYRGNSEELSVHIGQGRAVSYSFSGEEIFTNRGEGTIDLFASLDALEEALENGAEDGIRLQLGNLREAATHINECMALSGVRQEELRVAETNYTALYEKVTDLMADTENIDLDRIILELQMKSLTLQTSYSMISELEGLSILNFLR
ncbi:MAG: flagellar hook-associated protein FlgL [Syntrophales bacterium]|nr:flagellar hook-associated protein FlgL [Syntrophales bacterium]